MDQWINGWIDRSIDRRLFETAATATYYYSGMIPPVFFESYIT